MLRFALRNLLSRPLRSLLALTGLAVAIAGMVGLFSIAVGIDAMVSDAFARIPGVAVMQYGAPMPLFSRLPASFADEIESLTGVRTVHKEIWSRANVINEKRIASPPRFLFGSDLTARDQLEVAVYRDAIESGRALDASDIGTNHCVVSRHIAQEFDLGVGDTFVVNSTQLEVVGIYHCGTLLLDVTIMLDINRLRAMTNFDAAAVSAIYVEPQPGTDVEALAERIEQALKHHRLDSWQPSATAGLLASGSGNIFTDFFQLLQLRLQALAEPPPAPEELPATPPVEARRAEDWGERIDELSGDLNLFLGLLTTVGMTIAVLSIINTMLMSVSERIVEFGILRANGWSKRHLITLIACESGVLGVAGGLLGSTLGWTATQVVNWNWPERMNLVASPGLLLFGIFLSTLLGIGGGLYPAWWATRMLPMDAIRRG